MVYISLGVYTAPCSPATAAGRAQLTMTARVTHVGRTSPVTVHLNTHYTEPPSHRHGRHAAGAQTSAHIHRWLHQARHTERPCNRADTAIFWLTDMCQQRRHCLHSRDRLPALKQCGLGNESPDTGIWPSTTTTFIPTFSTFIFIVILSVVMFCSYTDTCKLI